MAVNWIAIALFSNFVYAIVNVIDHVLRRKHVSHDLSLTTLAQIPILLFLPLAAIVGDVSVPPLQLLIIALAAGVFSFLASAFYFYALSLEDTSTVIILWQTSALIVLVLSVVFLHEILTPLRYAGFAVLFVAGILLSVKGGIGRFRMSKGVIATLPAVAFWALHLTLLKFFYETQPFWNGFFWTLTGILLAVIFALFIPSQRGHITRNLLSLRRAGMILILASGVLTIGSDLLYFFAITQAPVSLVSVLGGTQSFFILVLAVALSSFFPHILKEDIGRSALLKKGVAIMLMVLGLYLIR
jgi:drug/metabolite transporter (DMT)-like permease